MSCNNMCSSNQSPGRPLIAMLSGILILLCISVMTVEAANDAAAQKNSGEFRPKAERVQIAPGADNVDQKLPERINDIQGDRAVATDPDTGTLPAGKAVMKGRAQVIEPASVSESTSPSSDSGNKKARPKPDPNFAGTSIGAAGAMGAPVVKEKKHSLNKRGEVAKARHVKSVVAHGDSPELQANNEKRRKIKEHFKTLLENREERKAKKTDGQAPAEGGSK